MDNENIEVTNEETKQEPIVDQIEQPVSEPVTEEIVENNNKKEKNPINKKLLFIIIGIVLIAIIAVILIVFVFNKGDKDKSSFKDPFENFDTSGFESASDSSIADGYKSVSYTENPLLTGEDNLIEDLNSGAITPNEYVLQLAYRTFGSKNLSSKYKINGSQITSSTVYLTQEAAKYFDKLDDQTIAYIAQKLYLFNYTFEGETVKTTSLDLKNNYSSKLLADNSYLDSTLYKLNKAKLSKDGNFIIYYATTGKIAVTEDYVNMVSDSLDNSVKKYKEYTGLDFKYSMWPNVEHSILPSDGDIWLKVGALLTKAGIGSDKLATAMPVYIIDTSDSALGYYSRSFDPFWNQMIEAYSRGVFFAGNNVVCQLLNCIPNDNKSFVKSFSTASATYALPFFAVNYNLSADDVAFTTQHELFHHYQNYICGDGKYTLCSSGLFTAETTANLMGLLVKDIGYGELNNHYVYVYLNDVEKSIDRVGIGHKAGEAALGYGAYVFAYNYMNIVPNGLTHLLQSLKYEKPLDYLYEKAGSKYKNVMATLAEKNLTHDYNKQALLPINNDRVIVNPPAHWTISIDSNDKTSKEVIEKSSIHYYYVQNTFMFKGNQQITFNSKDKGLLLLTFVDQNGKYRLIDSRALEGKTSINIADYKDYGGLAFAVVDYTNNTVKNSYDFEYKKDSSEESDIKPDIIGSGISDYQLAKARTIYCKRTENNQSSMTQKTEVLVNYKDSTKIKDMYVKELLDISDIDKSSPAYSLAESLLDISFQGIEQLFNMYFKNAKTISDKDGDVYSLTVKIPKEYFDNLGDVYNFKGNRKIDIINGLTEEGFACYLK